MAEVVDLQTLIAAPLLDQQPVKAATLVDRQELRTVIAEVQGLAGPPGPPGPPGVGEFVALTLPNGSTVYAPTLPLLAINEGATTPALAPTARALVWSSRLAAVVIWTGTRWARALGGGGVDPLALANDLDEVLVNDTEEVLLAG